MPTQFSSTRTKKSNASGGAGFTQSKLSNGVRVLLAPLRDTQAVTVMVFVKVGSRYESRALNGASHFLEHLMFKGTQRRPDTLTISKELDSIGAEFNAFTSKDHTAYYIKATKQHVDLALDMLSDMLVHSKFDATELNRERGVIIEEINMYEDNPMAHIEDVLELGLYGNTPLGWNIAGSKQGITDMDRSAMLRYKEEYYVGPNMWVVVAGNVPSNIRSLVAKYFGMVPKRKLGTPFVPQRQFAKDRVFLAKKNTEQVHLAIAAPAFAYDDKRMDALSVLTVLLGGTMSSRLFIEIRERMGLCYYIRAGANPYEQVGHVAIQAGLDKNRIMQAIPAILGSIEKVAQGDISAEEVRRAKEYIKGKFILGLEDSESLAGWLAKQALFQKAVKTPAARLAAIEKVTLAQVQAVAKKVLRRDAFRLALIGPYQDAAAFAKFLR